MITKLRILYRDNKLLSRTNGLIQQHMCICTPIECSFNEPILVWHWDAWTQALRALRHVNTAPSQLARWHQVSMKSKHESYSVWQFHLLLKYHSYSALIVSAGFGVLRNSSWEDCLPITWYYSSWPITPTFLSFPVVTYGYNSSNIQQCSKICGRMAAASYVLQLLET